MQELETKITKTKRLDPTIQRLALRAHPAYVAAELERMEIPVRYCPFHMALLYGAKTAVVETYRLFKDGQIPFPKPLNHVEKNYMKSVEDVFAQSEYIKQML